MKLHKRFYALISNNINRILSNFHFFSLQIEAAANASAGAYVNVGGVDGGESSVEFSGIWADMEGTYNVKVYYANGQDIDATQDLIVNNEDKITVNYAPTQGWHNFDSFNTLELNLQRGNNILIFSYHTYAVQIDKVEIVI